VERPCQDQSEIVCENRDCRSYRKTGTHIRRYGKTRKGVQRYQCKWCKATFTQTKGSFFYNLHTNPDTILECFTLVSQGRAFSSIRRLKGIKEDTLVSWLRMASAHVEEVESLLIAQNRLNRVQLEKLWWHAGRYSVTNH
jgi:transposase-like protein